MSKKHGNLSDAQYQEKIRDLQRRRERALEDSLRSIMKQPYGRRFIYWLIFELCGIDAPTMRMDIKDGACAAMHMSRNEGRRLVGIDIVEKVQELFPHFYLTMMSEMVNENQSAITAKEAAEGARGDDYAH